MPLDLQDTVTISSVTGEFVFLSGPALGLHRVSRLLTRVGIPYTVDFSYYPFLEVGATPHQVPA